MSKKESPALLGKNGFKYRERFGVIVICATEREQARMYERLRKLGLTLKVVTV